MRAARFALELDGAAAGAPSHASGGHAVGIVVEDGSTPTSVSKHIAGVKYEDITVTCGAGMSKDFYNWIKASFDGKELRHSGRLTSREADGTVVDAISFENALISEVTFPALDAGSKDAAKMTVKIRPETTQRSKAGPRQTTSQKQWHAANFRLAIDGVDCSGVTTIEAFTIKQLFADPGTPGANKVATLEPTKLEFPNLKLTTSASHGQDFYAWHKSMVIDGKDDKRAGTLTFLADDLHHALFTLTFSQLGIFQVDPQPPSARTRAARLGCHVWCVDTTLT